MNLFDCINKNKREKEEAIHRRHEIEETVKQKLTEWIHEFFRKLDPGSYHVLLRDMSEYSHYSMSGYRSNDVTVSIDVFQGGRIEIRTEGATFGDHITQDWYWKSLNQVRWIYDHKEDILKEIAKQYGCEK